jgi:hypothetical protein
MSNSKEPVDIGCLQAMEFFYAWLDNELDGKDVADFEHHLSHCKSCWSRAEVERALTEHIKRSAGAGSKEGSAVSAPGSLHKRLEKLLDKL